MTLPIVIRGGAFRDDERLRSEVAAIAADSFTDTVSRLEREFQHCDTLYLFRDGSGQITCFFMVAWENLDVDGASRSALYTGLSATRPDLKGKGRIIQLYNYCAYEAQQWEVRHGQRLTMWGMTATPSVYLAARRLFADTQPTDDGRYSDESGRVALAVRRRLGFPDDGAHPFVIQGIAAGVHYTEDEQRRIAQVSRAKRFTLFHRLGVDETRGDRLLFVGRIPDVLWRPIERDG
jgi:hypothetical protein